MRSWWIFVVAFVGQAQADPKPDADLVTAPPWIARTYRDEPVTTHVSDGEQLRAFHMTYTLQRVGDRAQLTVVERRQPAGEQTEAWKLNSTRTYTGTSTTTGATTTLHLVSDKAVLDYTCTKKSLAVAGATAKRALKKGGRDEGCGDPGVWAPRATKSVSVLLCKDAAAPDDPALAFAVAPGVEYAHVEHDCLVGGGYRAAPKDGSIAPVGGLL